ncbi:hypothetical protein DFR86_00805 [Acidianus sulfidivorans JP7]|uniref:Uncharacterized protein n=1 Tax=Acidianus sulfidivorans JP7 TaxID=619593 RepID=A0A2U9IJR2_9CREN|nr:hypothetical protein [Acidianus sulfidivorans]AWR96225.1 hypothetical protein DFR86_00805 [Acidianus sulfidivorans JP7]
MLNTGFPFLDSIIGKDEIVEFFSTDYELLSVFYHRVIAYSAPVHVVIVSERGGLNPYLIKRFQNIFNNYNEIFLRRAFKVEDVDLTIDSMGDNDLVIIDPYHHRKDYAKIISSLRKGKGRKFLFSFMNREKEGSTFGLHSAHSIIKLVRDKSGFRFIVIKSVSVREIEIPNSIYDLYGKKTEEDSGLLKYLI